METNDCVNVLLIGEAGVGKSTLINSLANYFQYDSLEAARKSGLACLIPTVFTLTDDQYKEQIVHFGFNNGNVGKSSGTTACNDYVFNVQNIPYPIRFIDTPGVGSSRGAQADEVNIRRIVEHVKSYTHINAICFLLQPNVNTLGEYFKYTIEHLLGAIREASDNIIFVFTHSRSTFYKPGETLTILQEIIGSYKISLSKENMFCLDNEAFRYGVALQQGFKYTAEQFEDFERSWNVSSSSARDMLLYIVERLQPIESKKIAATIKQGAISRIQIKEIDQASGSKEELICEIDALKEQATGFHEQIYILKRYIRDLKGEFDVVKRQVSADNQELFDRVGKFSQEDEVQMLRLQNNALLNEQKDFVNQIRSLQCSERRESDVRNQVLIDKVDSIIQRQENLNITSTSDSYNNNFSNNTVHFSLFRK